MNVNPSVFIGDNLPVNNLTFFDAIFFCNAKSKKDGMDTVYTDINNVRGSIGNGCKNMDFRTNSKANGYRLPSRAEWELAYFGKSKIPLTAKPYRTNGGDMNISYFSNGKETKYYWSDNAKVSDFAWFKGNSESKPHIVGTKKPNENGLYDMSGNISELCGSALLDNGPWTNVWYNLPVNGGHFNSLPKGLCGGSSGIATIGLTNEYIGFRIARNISD
jgi:formylglycine-generating enzyme required for sulfatase activity